MAEKKPEKAVAVDEKPTTVAVDAQDQKMRELTLRLLWQASRVIKGATLKEINFYMKDIRNWVGEVRAEELEKNWRLGKG